MAWLLLLCIALGAAGVTWLAVMRGAPPSNAVLISEAPTVPPTAASAEMGQPTGTVEVASVQNRGQGGAPPDSSPAVLVVYISGAVRNPGMYTLPADSRLGDAVAAAGGMQEDADADAVNLAARLMDEEHVRVPRLGQTLPAADNTPAPKEVATATAVRKTGAGPGSQASGKININTAGAGELEQLPGIGPVLAQRIVTNRLEQGPFKSVEELARVPGIKEAVLSKVRSLVTVGP